MSDDRTYQGITHKEIRQRWNIITKDVGASLDDELNRSLYANKDPSAPGSNIIASPSRDIWGGMAPQSMYYVYKNKKGVYYVFDFGVTLSIGANGILPNAVYEHKPPPNKYTQNTNFDEYFMLSTGVTSRAQATGTLSLVIPLSGLFVAVYDQADLTQKLYSASTDVFSSTSLTSDNSAKQQTPPDKVVKPNTPTPLPAAGNGATGNGVPQTVSATSLCTGPYARAINKYNTHALKPPATGKPIACSTAATEAKTKLTVTITPSVQIALGSVTFKDVPMEKKDDAWFGFMMIAPTTASSSQWIQLEVKEQKLSYTACLGQCDATSHATSPKYEQKKDLEVKHDKDKKYKFEGGTVEYTEEDPFHKGNLALILGLSLGLGLGIPLLLFIILALAYFFSPKETKESVQRRLSYVREPAINRLPLLRSDSLLESSTSSPGY